jgi:hypothetical protein
VKPGKVNSFNIPHYIPMREREIERETWKGREEGFSYRDGKRKVT